MAYVATDMSLPLSLDVQVSVSKLATLGRLNLSNLCVVGENLGFLPNANRIRFYASLPAVALDFSSTTDVYKAAATFFSQSPRPAQMSIGEYFEGAQPALLASAAFSSAELTALAAVTTGSMILTLNGVAYPLTGLNFSATGASGSAIATIEDVVSVIRTKFQSAAVLGRVYTKTLPGGAKRLVITPTAVTHRTAETHSIPATPGPYTVTATNAATYLQNVEVKLTAGPNTVWTRVYTLGALATGKYMVNELTGVYTFAAADQGVGVTFAYDTYVDATGATATVAFPTTAETGVDVGGLLNLTSAEGGSVMYGYTPTDMAGELDNIQNAATQAGQFVYGWCLVKTLRDLAIQEVAAAWALAQDKAMMPLVTNDVNALDASYTTDLGSTLKPLLNKRVVAIYSDHLDDYPDVSILAYMLSVNYMSQASTVTAKFKALPGVNTVALTSTQWAVLNSKGYNTYTLTGLNAQVWREGGTEDTSTPWFMDTVINMDNFVEDLAVNLYNVFLRNGKVPYTTKGQMMLMDACKDTGNQYTYNGTFADRQIDDPSKKSGISIIPAVVIDPTPISQISVAYRATRVGPPINMIVQEAGAIHSIAVAVQLVS